MNHREHKGQVALILILIMTVVSALAVSLASRSTVDTRIQQSESLSIQALLFAQTGLEQLVLNPAPTAGQQDSSYYAVTSSEGSDVLEMESVAKGSTVEINLVDADFLNLSGFSVNWGPDNSSPGGQPAIFISVIESTGKISDYAYDYAGLNGFTPASDISGSYPKSTGKINLLSGVIKIRITALGSPAKLQVLPLDSGALFPSQIKSMKSIGSVPSGDGSVKYGLQYDESAYDTVPAVFDYALFSGGNISQ